MNNCTTIVQYQPFDWSFVCKLIRYDPSIKLYYQIPTAKTYVESFLLACECGYIQTIDFITKTWSLSQSLMHGGAVVAASYRHYDLISYFLHVHNLELTRFLSNLMLTNAYLDNDIEILDWLSTFDYVCPGMDLIRRICIDGNLDMYKYFIEKFPQGDYRGKEELYFVLACVMGHLDFAIYMKNKWPKINHRCRNDFAFKAFGYHPPSFDMGALGCSDDYRPGRNCPFHIIEWVVTLYSQDDVGQLIRLVYNNHIGRKNEIYETIICAFDCENIDLPLNLRVYIDGFIEKIKLRDVPKKSATKL